MKSYKLTFKTWLPFTVCMAVYTFNTCSNSPTLIDLFSRLIFPGIRIHASECLTGSTNAARNSDPKCRSASSSANTLNTLFSQRVGTNSSKGRTAWHCFSRWSRSHCSSSSWWRFHAFLSSHQQVTTPASVSCRWNVASCDHNRCSWSTRPSSFPCKYMDLTRTKIS